MQFLWKYIDEMVGKGIELHILAELFFYAALSFVPNALPIAILFASLMTFGNLGEQFELLAMKSSGISLLRIMQPLTIFLILTSIATFYFQNNVIPVSQVKFTTILYSVKSKSPELEIPESTFYNDIRGKNIYVRHKDKKRKLLMDVLIYDYSEGFNNARVILADSGRLKTSTDKKYLILSLFSGESFENVKGNSKTRARDAKDPVPYRRETFDTMEMLIEFDANFNMTDESVFQGRFISKNLASLKQSIDSMTVRLDSINELESRSLLNQSYRKTLPGVTVERAEIKLSRSDTTMSSKRRIDFDSLYRAQEPAVKASILQASKRGIENMQMNYFAKASVLKYEDKQIRLHHTEMHRKFTLSFACLVFFFIGAPLGAIIRKGGLGAPAVISVVLYIIYYIIDTMGYKMARDAVWAPWQGMWLSSAILLPTGIFLTYKAVNDSVILNAETYLEVFKRITGRRELRKIERKELIMEKPDYQTVSTTLQKLTDDCRQYLASGRRRLSYFNFWHNGEQSRRAEAISSMLEETVETLKNSDQILVLNKAMDFPYISKSQLIDNALVRKYGGIMAILFPIGVVLYLIADYNNRLTRHDIKITARVAGEMNEIIAGIK
jgi:lipopolysaccharide export system permease protein